MPLNRGIELQLRETPIEQNKLFLHSLDEGKTNGQKTLVTELQNYMHSRKKVGC